MSLTPTVTDAPAPYIRLPHYAQQDAFADLDLDPLTISQKDQKKVTVIVHYKTNYY